MDVVSDKKVDRLVASYGTTRIYELDDKTWLTAEQGTVSWRNNNPGNLKFEYAGVSDSETHRTKEGALSLAQRAYKGVVDLDHHGNVVFETYEAGRAAQKQLIETRHAKHTVETIVPDYSRPDYSGAVHPEAQTSDIYATALAAGHDLHGKMVKDMTEEEKGALLDGISHFEQWKAGTVAPTPVMTEDQLAALKASHPAPAAPAPAAHGHGDHAGSHKQGDHGAAVGALQTDLATLGVKARNGSAIHPDSHFGPHTKEAVEAFQTAHGLKADGVAGPATMAAISEAKGHLQAATPSVPTLLDARHPANGIYEQAHICVARIDQEQGRTPGPHTQNFAGSLTSAATAAGFSRIDHVALSDDANRGYAIQGDLNSPFKKYVEVDVVQAVQTPLAQSSEAAAVNVQNNAQQQAQTQQPVQQQMAPDPLQQAAGPSIAR
jgi:peptidoglycan hydrolase-like protein with peptidoglycan-binding domain